MALSDGSKAVVSVTSGYRERSTADLKRRGMGCPRLVIGDGHLGIWGALRNVYPQAEEALLESSDPVHKPALLILRQIPYAETREEAQRLKKVFQHWCRQRGLTPAELIEQDWDRMVTFYNYPKKVRTTNPVESPFAALRLRTDAAKRFKKVENAQALIWKMLLVAEKRFRRLKAPELMKDVWRSVAEGTMGSNLVVFPSPAFNQNLRLQQSVKDLEVQQLVSELSIETLDISILPGAPRFDVERPDTHSS